MKHITKFNEFMREVVNLNQSRIDTLTTRVESINNFLKGDDVFGEIHKSTDAQGSYSHKTIIKPSDRKREFDADVVFYVDEKGGWDPKDYIDELYKRFRLSGIYKDKCGRGTRCVTIDYVGEFHLDIVPCIQREVLFFSDTYHVCNRQDNVEEETDPQGYAEWLVEKNTEVKGNNLVKVIRLLKYLRNIKQTFSCKSILLTTLIANQVGGFGDFFDPYTDLPSTLKVLINRLDAFLQANERMPVISNPVSDHEDFNRHWDQEKYDNFKNQINRYSGWINDAFEEEGQSESIEKWQKIFGEDFGKQVASNVLLAISNDPRNNALIPAHVEKLRWPAMCLKNLPIRVTIHKANDASPVIQTLSREVVGEQVGKHVKVRMEYLSGISNSHELYWQVVNTGEDAKNNNCLRGSLFSGGAIRWEDTLYKGLHWVECFIVDKRRQVCTGRSGRYFVNIG